MPSTYLRLKRLTAGCQGRFAPDPEGVDSGPSEALFVRVGRRSAFWAAPKPRGRDGGLRCGPAVHPGAACLAGWGLVSESDHASLSSAMLRSVLVRQAVGLNNFRAAMANGPGVGRPSVSAVCRRRAAQGMDGAPPADPEGPVAGAEQGRESLNCAPLIDRSNNSCRRRTPKARNESRERRCLCQGWKMVLAVLERAVPNLESSDGGSGRRLCVPTSCG
jgi:hypothetical protein